VNPQGTRNTGRPKKIGEGICKRKGLIFAQIEERFKFWHSTVRLGIQL
jgi:hypothetical protein